MDLNAVLKIAQSQSDESNPFSPVNDVTNQLGQAVIQGAPKMGTKESIIAGLISGLASGFTKNLTTSHSNRQADFANQVLFGGAKTRPSGMDESVFNTMRNARSIFDREQTMAIEAENRKNQNDIKKDVIGKMAGGIAENPYTAEDQVSAITQSLGPLLGMPQQPRPVAERAAPTEAARSTPQAIGQNVDGSAMLGQPAPSAVAAPNAAEPDMRALMKKYRGNESLVTEDVKRQMALPEKQATQLGSLRDEFTKLPEVKAFVTSDIGFKSLQNAMKDPSATSDLELIRGAIQSIEPGMAVREGEAAAVEGSAAIPDQWKATIQKSLTGGTGLPPEVRDGILRIAARRYNEYATKFNGARNFYIGQAEKQQLDPTGISYLGEATLAPDEMLYGGQQRQQAPGATPGAPPPGLSFEEFRAWKAQKR